MHGVEGSFLAQNNQGVLTLELQNKWYNILISIATRPNEKRELIYFE